MDHGACLSNRKASSMRNWARPYIGYNVRACFSLYNLLVSGQSRLRITVTQESGKSVHPPQRLHSMTMGIRGSTKEATKGAAIESVFSTTRHVLWSITQTCSIEKRVLRAIEHALTSCKICTFVSWQDFQVSARFGLRITLPKRFGHSDKPFGPD